jgi:2-oxoglutarate/2-oxoacid ferredoxin oxidoreductase subunit alpha
MDEVMLMKGNEAIAEAAIRAGADAYFGYPITPQSEIIEYLAAKRPHETTGMVVLQAESEIGAINMVFGAASAGKKAMTSSSSPGISLKLEAISYMAGAELPCLIVNVMRGGPGLGTIQPSQADYFQATRGGGHGDYQLIVLAPASVQEMADFVKLGFDLAFKYRNPVMLLSDGVIGQMMEKVRFSEPVPRSQDLPSWALTGRKGKRKRNVITSLNLAAEDQEQHNLKLKAKYDLIAKEETRFEALQCNDAEYVFIAFGISARLCEKAIKTLREKGYKTGLLRPITLSPFPYLAIQQMTQQVKCFISVEMNTGQMIYDVKLAVEGKTRVEYFGRTGGMIATPDEICNYFTAKFGG